ncbi:MAG: sulfatase-like hydrolase/transferase [Planctomycetota bacterium]|jgi:arylsulfatase A-like enzyme
MKRREFLKTIAAGAAVVMLPGGLSSAAKSVERPNIIFLLADDQRWDRFGFMGNDWLQTPHLDKLAKDGVYFENAYHASPICQPARASIMLGQYVNTHFCGFDRPAVYSITSDEFSRSYPAVLRKAGFYTGFVGKFGFPVAEQKVMHVTYVNGRNMRETQFWKKDEYMPVDQFDVWSGFSGQGSYQGPGGKHGTEHRGDQAIAFIDQAEKQNKPFCLSVSFKAPHGPFEPSKKWDDHYSNVTIPIPENAADEDHERLPDVVKTKYRGRGGLKDKYQSSMQKYHGLISGIDDVVGRIREKLSQLGIADNTVIIYSSDNGYFCQSKKLHGKSLLYRESVRAPLFIYDPRLGENKKHRKVKGLASTIDFAPTMLELAGIKAPASMQGKSLLPLIAGDKEQIHDAVFSENNFATFSPMLSDISDDQDRRNFQTVRSKSVRTPQYKYIRYYETDPIVEELWDIEKDPLEKQNLAANRQYQKVLNQMRQRCDKFITETKAQRQPLIEPEKPVQ